MKKTIGILILTMLLIESFTFKKEIPFTYKEYLNLVNYFDSKSDVTNFFEFKKGDVVADIGAGEGKYEGAFSLLTDSVTFYCEEIDSKLLNEKKMDKMVKHYTEIKDGTQTNTFKFCIGTEKSTNLPDNTFDKVIILSAFHEFTYIDEMIEDIKKKLKTNGKIYILDAHCTEKGHVNYTLEQVNEKMKQHGLSLMKNDATNSKNVKNLYKAVYVKLK